MFFIHDIIQAFKDLLPSKEDNIKVWVIKVSTLTVILLIFGTAAFYLLLNTTLGKEYKIERLQQKQEVLSHTELALHMRQMFHLLNRVKSNDANVRGVYVLLLIDKKTGNVVTHDTEAKDTSALIWVWSVPGNQVNSLDIMEHGINLAKQDIEPKLRQEGGCFDGDIQEKILGVFKRSIIDFRSNRFVICPIYARGGNYLTAATVMFYIDSDTIQDGIMIKTKNAIASQERAIMYRDSLWETTNLVQNYFYDYKIPYIFYYNEIETKEKVG